MKKFLNKYKDLLIILLVLVSVIGGTYFLSKSAENKNFKKIDYEEYEKLKNENKDVIVFIGSSENSELFKMVKDFSKSKNLTFKYIYEESLTAKQKEKLNYEDSMIIYAADGKEEIYTEEFNNLDLTKFFIDIEVLQKAYITIDIDEYVELINDENVVVFIARDGCGYCDKFKPVVNDVVTSNDITVYMLDLTNTSEDDYAKLYATASYFTEEQWGTPTTLIFNKGEVVDVLGGYVEAETFKEFLTSNGVI